LRWKQRWSASQAPCSFGNKSPDQSKRKRRKIKTTRKFCFIGLKFFINNATILLCSLYEHHANCHKATTSNEKTQMFVSNEPALSLPGGLKLLSVPLNFVLFPFSIMIFQSCIVLCLLVSSLKARQGLQLAKTVINFQFDARSLFSWFRISWRGLSIFVFAGVVLILVCFAIWRRC